MAEAFAATAEPLAEEPPTAADGRLLCSYCGARTELLETSEAVYGRDFGPVYRCPKGCGWVGVHKNSQKRVPLGRVANRELRKAKQEAHAAFDRLWRTKMQKEGCRQNEARRAGYQWLAAQLGLDAAVCHIGMMSVEGCRRVVEVCQPFHRGAA